MTKPIRLDLGDPGYPPPETALTGAAVRLRKGDARYGPPHGLPELRRRIAARVTEQTGKPVAEDQVVVTAGATGALLAILAALVQAVDGPLTLAVPDPGYPPYRGIAAQLGCRTVTYPCPAGRGYLPDPEAVHRLGSEVQAVVINSPHNPTGAVWPRSLLAEWAGSAARWGWSLISDEVYLDLVWGDPAASLAAVAPGGVDVYTVGSFSKTYGLAGWRVGYAVVPAGMADRVARCHWLLTMGASTLAQSAALGALNAGPEYLSRVLADLERRREIASTILRQADIPFYMGPGGFFAWICVQPLGMSGAAFAGHCWTEARLAVMDGSLFGESGRDFVRLSVAAGADEVAEGCERLAAVWRRLQRSGA